MKPLILYVDDEPNNLLVFEASMPPEWDVKAFSSPVEALQALHQWDPAVIITDQRMPELNGVEFLEEARKIRPHAIRVIVTGYSDENLVIQSVRNAQIFDYIRKPWDPVDLEASMRRAIEAYQSQSAKATHYNELIKREALLVSQNQDLLTQLASAEVNQTKSKQACKELECWISPAIFDLIKTKHVTYPLLQDLVLLKFAAHECSPTDFDSN